MSSSSSPWSLILLASCLSGLACQETEAKSGGQGGQGQSGGAGNGGAAGKSCTKSPENTSMVDPKTALLSIANDPPTARGIFDPDLEYPAGAPAGAMSYSAVEATNNISTRIAISSDEGTTWTYATQANQSTPLTLPLKPGSKRCPKGQCTGRWVHEVSSLVFDADDPITARRWKLFTHSYLVLGGDKLAYDLGRIEIHVAQEPTGPWKPEGVAVGWESETPISNESGTDVSKFSEMKDCVALTEPSASWVNGRGLELAVGCATGQSIRIELLRSTDHGKSFSRYAQLVRAEDALCLGGERPEVNAASLFALGSKNYLAVSVAGKNDLGFVGYRGCQILELNPAGNAVVRDAQGRPRFLRNIDGVGKPFIGACGAAAGTSSAGYLVSRLTNDSPPKFRIAKLLTTLP